jgi:hypothetical protein
MQIALPKQFIMKTTKKEFIRNILLSVIGITIADIMNKITGGK